MTQYLHFVSFFIYKKKTRNFAYMNKIMLKIKSVQKNILFYETIAINCLEIHFFDAIKYHLLYKSECERCQKDKY